MIYSVEMLVYIIKMTKGQALICILIGVLLFAVAFICDLKDK